MTIIDRLGRTVGGTDSSAQPSDPNSGIAIKTPCRVATTANITLAGLQTIDGVSVVETDRVLVKDQTSGIENGIYSASSGNWLRTKDWDGSHEIVQETLVAVGSGVVSSGQIFAVTTTDPIVIGTTSVTLQKFSGGADTAAIEDLTGTGVLSRTGSATWALRTLAAPAAGLSITNPAGIAGDPTFALANDLSALEALSSTGIAVRTGSDAWAQRTITGTSSEITVTNGSGASGNPTLSLPSALTFTGKTIAGGTFSSPAAITGLPDPSSAQDAATKNYVDTVAQGLDPKPSVKAATTANITLSAAQTIDGIALVAGDRCLVKNQSTASQNGIYVVAAGSWTRATDADAWSELPGAFVIVEQGTVNADTGWLCTVDQGGTLGTTVIAFSQFAGVGTYSAGVGLKLTGSQFSVDINGASAGAAVSDTDTTLVYQGANPLKQTFTAIKTWVQGFMVAGPASAVTARIATFNGTTGRLIQDGGAVISTDGTFASNVDTKVPTEKAVKTYADAIGVTVNSVTPTIGNTGGGSYTSASASGKYIQIGKLVIFNFAATVVTVGTASGLVTLTLPAAPATPQNTAGIGKELALNNKSVTAELTTGINNLLRLYFYDASSTLVAGSTVVGSITYFAA